MRSGAMGRWRAGRGGPDARVDLRDAGTFGAFRGCDAVVNCAEATGEGRVAGPVEAMRACAREGALFVESSADPDVVGRLMGERVNGGRASPETGVGAVIGAGLFPGLSNLLAAEAVRAAGLQHGAGAADGVDLGVRISPLAGAGGAMCRLMSRLLERESVWIEAGEARSGPPMSSGRVLEFPGGARKALSLGLVEAPMLARGAGLRNVRTFIAVRPAWMGALAGATAPLLRLRWLRVAQARAALPGMVLVRKVVLRRRQIAIEMCAQARSGGEDIGEAATLSVQDGAGATGAAIAAMTLLALERGREQGRGPGPGAGLVTPEAAFRLGEVVDRMKGVWEGAVRVRSPRRGDTGAPETPAPPREAPQPSLARPLESKR